MNIIQPYSGFVNVCTSDMLSMRVAGFIRLVLIEYFSHAPNVAAPPLKQYTFLENPEDSRIRIELSHKWDPRIADKCPAIIIRGDEVRQWLPLLNANECMLGSKPATVSGWMVTVTLICISRQTGEAELLGKEVLRLFTTYRRNIMQYLHLANLMVIGAGALSKIPDTATYAVPVQLVCHILDAAVAAAAPQPPRIRLFVY